ncbi:MULTISPECIES: prolyl oligopeptidase family serine peptidase [unclassified Sphingopyxis]|uniref:S9 family peptidase n=1 Tax=unclassified Sphingopyxis TaxID=2614943 RepID=UPI0028628096|nr:MULTISPECIES: prolyl oligopeptidase family serine peptidase [unclassified Sphingopyxis]MDR7060769.1 dipeptidyl aminopeptidase/acylaminoacyl peptidase [Sphingopyxis sp. BE235]MDR7181226.1 dipeptidyl aminopeptidase/acylaminoacyl peptidase [Sphingopyxis sp. BE249]
MRYLAVVAALALPIAPALGAGEGAPAAEPKPAALVADGVPAVPAALAAATRPYLEYRTAAFVGWNPADRSMLIATRFGNTAQLHRVARPLGAREQLTFEAEPVSHGGWSPVTGDVMLIEKDIGGSEFYQIFAMKDGRLTMLTDGKSRNSLDAWSKDGSLVAFTSTRRNGRDNDIYVMDPRDPASARLAGQVDSNGWSVAGFAPDKSWALVTRSASVEKTDLFRLDLASGKMTPVGDHGKKIAFSGASFAPDGTIWVASDAGSDVQRLGTLDPATGAFTPRGPAEKWDVEAFDISGDGRFIAYAVNEAGVSRLRLLDVASGRARTVDALPAGVIGHIDIAPWGAIGIGFTSARSAADAYSIDPETLAVTRWTQSETGGLDVARNVEPELVSIKSFDGTAMSGFLYRPDPAKFPGKRPLIMHVHGGPESQWRPEYLGSTNYIVNELGVAYFYPNVRGSTGYGKRFVGLDNGPFKREDSVKDMGVFLDVLAKDARLDASRFGLTGRSYGGYMCYAAATHFADKLRANLCVVAISDFVTFLENTQEYRRDLRRVEYGDERDPAQRRKLTEISPLTRVADIRKPLFVVTGANDPRVPASEADQVVAAVRKGGGTAWHLVATNEGHQWGKKENVDYTFWSSLLFWQTYLLN